MPRRWQGAQQWLPSAAARPRRTALCGTPLHCPPALLQPQTQDGSLHHAGDESQLPLSLHLLRAQFAHLCPRNREPRQRQRPQAPHLLSLHGQRGARGGPTRRRRLQGHRLHGRQLHLERQRAAHTGIVRHHAQARHRVGLSGTCRRHHRECGTHARRERMPICGPGSGVVRRRDSQVCEERHHRGRHSPRRGIAQKVQCARETQHLDWVQSARDERDGRAHASRGKETQGGPGDV